MLPWMSLWRPNRIPAPGEIPARPRRRGASGPEGGCPSARAPGRIGSSANARCVCSRGPLLGQIDFLDDFACVLERSDSLRSHGSSPLRGASGHAARGHRDVLGDLAAVLDGMPADPDVADDEARAGRHFVFEPQHHARRSAHDPPVVADWRAIRFCEAAVVPIHDVEADGIPEGDVEALPDEHVHVERHSGIDRRRLTGQGRPGLEVVAKRRRGGSGACARPKRHLQRVDVLDVVDDAVRGVPAVELVVRASRSGGQPGPRRD